MKISDATVAVLLAAAARAVQAEEHQGFSWGELAVRLPEPLSDHTASLDPATKLIYIAGGCGM